MAKKFLVVGDSLRMSWNVEYHKELVPDNNTEQIKGGGIFHEDKFRNRLYLYGSSFDFNTAKKEDILNACKNFLFPIDLEGWEVYISHEESLSKALLQEVPDYKIEEWEPR